MVSNNAAFIENWIDELLSFQLPIESVPSSFHNQNGLHWDVLRTDRIHPICSGNKLFKLKYYLLEAAQKNYTMIHTEGGPWSNHIVATAFAAQQTGLTSMGLIQGGKPALLSATLEEAIQFGMQIEYTGWGQPPKKTMNPNAYYIPQGGFGPLGVKGAKEIITEAAANDYTHIVCAVGTGTMLAGIAQHQGLATFIGIPVLKHTSIDESIQKLSPHSSFQLIHDYHFGGYAKKNQVLFDFMNHFYDHTNIPTDFVYTAKLMFAINDLIQKRFFPEGSRILAIHSGGLQGNRSLTNGEICY